MKEAIKGTKNDLGSTLQALDWSHWLAKKEFGCFNSISNTLFTLPGKPSKFGCIPYARKSSEPEPTAGLTEVVEQHEKRLQAAFQGPAPSQPHPGGYGDRGGREWCLAPGSLSMNVGFSSVHALCNYSCLVVYLQFKKLKKRTYIVNKQHTLAYNYKCSDPTY